jgi:hypothetical protein
VLVTARAFASSTQERLALRPLPFATLQFAAATPNCHMVPRLAEVA